MRTFFSILALLLFSAQVFSQSAHLIKPWPLSQILVQKTILSVVQSKDGTLWIATLAGVDRYNGSEIVKYRPSLPQEGHIQSSSVKEIIETIDGAIFVASPDAGLLAFDEKSNRFLSPDWIKDKKVPTSRISAAFTSTDGNIWIGYESGHVARFSTKLLQVEFTELGDSSRVTGFSQTIDGSVLTATASGRIFDIRDNLQNSTELKVKKSCRMNFSELDEIPSIGSNSLWLGTRDHGLLLLDLTTGQCVKPITGVSSGEQITTADIHEIHVDPQSGTTWAATDQGLYEIDKNRHVTRFGTDNSGLSNDEVSAIAQGDDGLYWIGTYTGLNYLVPTVFQTYDKRSNSKLDSIVGIDSIDKTGSWIASYNGLMFYDSIEGIHYDLSQKKPEWDVIDKKIISLEVSNTGIWIGYRATGLEFVPFGEPSDTIYSWRSDGSQRISSESVSAILSSAEGKIFVGTYGGGLNIVSLEGDTEIYSVGNNRVIMLYQTRDSSVWIGTESGLFSLDIDTHAITNVPLAATQYSEKSTPIVWDMVETASGELWLATMHHGLFVWNRKKASGDQADSYSPIEAKNAFNIVYALEQDNQGYIWASTDKGLVKIDPISKQIVVFSQQHGLNLSEFDFGVSHKDISGNLYFGGSNGYTKFDPMLIDPIQRAPSILISKIVLPSSVLNSVSYLAEIDSIQLTHKDYFIQFDFSVLDFLDPEKNQYRYMLDGFDHDWIENGTRNSATYTSLPPGDYTLRVQGANSAGVWNREGLSLEIEVLPPPWRSWWAYTIYLLSLMFLVWLGMRAYNSYVIERRARAMAIKMIEAEERADDEMQEQLEIHDDLVKSVYQHSVSTLNLVRDFIATKGAHRSDENALELTQASVSRVEALALLEECLYYQNEVLLADLNKYTNIITTRLLKYAPGGQETITTINDVTSQPIPIGQASPLAIALYELLENSIQHAFESAAGAHYIQISFGPGGPEGAGYRLVVQDNGAGIPANIDLLSAQTPGFAVVAAMAERLGGALSFETENGTLIAITFPRDAT